MRRPTTKLPPAPPLDSPESAKTFGQVASVVNQPGRRAAKPKGLFGAVQTLFAKPDLSKQTENVFRRDVAWRPLVTPFNQLPDESGQGGPQMVVRKGTRKN